MSLENYTWKDAQRARREARAWRWFEFLLALILFSACVGLIERTAHMDRNTRVAAEIRQCLWQQRGTAYVNNIRDDVTCVEDGR